MRNEFKSSVPSRVKIFPYRKSLTHVTSIKCSLPAYVTCPTAYLCDKSDGLNVSMCVSMSQVCDGNEDCLENDDEKECGMYHLSLHATFYFLTFVLLFVSHFTQVL